MCFSFQHVEMSSGSFDVWQAIYSNSSTNPLYVMGCVFLCLPLESSLCLFSRTLKHDITYFFIAGFLVCFVFILLGVLWAFWLCGFLYISNFRIFAAVASSNVSSAPFSLFFLWGGGLWGNSKNINCIYLCCLTALRFSVLCFDYVCVFQYT